MEKEKSWWQKYGWVVLLVLIVFILFYVAFQTYKEQKNESKEEIDKKLRLYESRRDRLKKIIDSKKSIKKKLELYVSLLYFISRICLVGFGVFLFYSTNYFYIDPTIDLYLSVLAIYALIFTAVSYLIFGVPNDVHTMLKEVKPKIEIWIYGKYLEIDDVICTDEKELSKVEEKIKTLSEKFPKSS